MASLVYDRVSYLQSYLGQLILLQKEGHKVSNEINQVLTAINNELGLGNEISASSGKETLSDAIKHLSKYVGVEVYEPSTMNCNLQFDAVVNIRNAEKLIIVRRSLD